ncbi:MAG: alpha-glucosidase/alpha-galactosidase [Chloroflexi bacterium]|nr:alpha-glucosidase/alpha-galactosidase [Chloroflexota bacterium]
MIKIAMIGAGSIGFTRGLLRDILTVPEFADAEFRFMDISPQNLEMAASLCRKTITENGLPARIQTTTHQREAVCGADYVICTARVGGLEAFAHDIEIPLKYGVDQCVGDTLGPGGIFYALRTIPVLLDIAADMRELAPGALLLNYSNPMAMNMWAVRRAGGVRAVGLCHGVQGGHALIAQALGLPAEEVDYVCAGINHQTWYIQVTHKGKDMLPFLLEAMEKDPEIARDEPCRIDILRRFGYFSTESNGHLSEYLPWYRKRPAELNRWISDTAWIHGRTAGYLNECRKSRHEYEQHYAEWLAQPAEHITPAQRSHEHASYILEGIETGRTYRGHFNVGNSGLITNLPRGCTVELPCYADATGINPAWSGPLPMACAATCRVSINVQEMAVEAALTGNRELVKLAVLHDPLTGAVCNPEEVWAMCDEMFDALAPWMPQFNSEGRTWPDISQPNAGVLRAVQAAGDYRPPSLR